MTKTTAFKTKLLDSLSALLKVSHKPKEIKKIIDSIKSKKAHDTIRDKNEALASYSSIINLDKEQKTQELMKDCYVELIIDDAKKEIPNVVNNMTIIAKVKPNDPSKVKKNKLKKLVQEWCELILLQK